MTMRFPGGARLALLLARRSLSSSAAASSSARSSSIHASRAHRAASGGRAGAGRRGGGVGGAGGGRLRAALRLGSGSGGWAPHGGPQRAPAPTHDQARRRLRHLGPGPWR